MARRPRGRGAGVLERVRQGLLDDPVGGGADPWGHPVRFTGGLQTHLQAAAGRLLHEVRQVGVGLGLGDDEVDRVVVGAQQVEQPLHLFHRHNKAALHLENRSS